MDKSFRIHTNILNDTLLQVNMKQDFDFLEVLSLKLRQKDAYRLHSSNYGVIIGRVLANDAFGIPNAKLSIFVERDSNDATDMEALYPYSEVTTKDKEGRRYNILPDYSDDDCYRVVGTFPNKRLMLDEDIQLEVYDKYYKYTTVTNNAGDYMIFGVPTGSTTVHVDIDLSDIGVLSQKPRDFEYKGYNLTMFDSPSQFKESTNLDSLTQLFSQNRSVFVYPFWGDADNGIASITRADIQIQYEFEPTCVFMGSIVSDNESHAIGHKCAPDVENGMNDQLVGGSGTIEMIRKTTDGLVEEYQIQGNQLIDENGVWCYQIPMNLDYIGTDEYGNIVPTDNPNKGIPTRTQVRFRFSKTETSDEGFSRHTAKYLVPMNPIFSERNDVKVRLGDNSVRSFGVEPVIPVKGSEIEKMYTFGSSTPIYCFRDLYWNNVYSVKNYIPKSQVAHRAYAKNYTGLKGSNLAEDQNPIPFNKLRIDLPFVYIVVCLLFTIVTYIIWFINFFIICTIDDVLSIFHRIKNIRIFGAKPFGWLPVPNYLGCIVLSAGLSEGNVAYYPGCRCESGLDASDCPDDMEGSCRKSTDVDELLDKIQRNLALEFKIVKLDLYQDWVNGCLYMPLWYWRKRKKKTFLFFTLSGAKNEYCSDSSLYSRLKTYVTCNIRYYDNDFTVSDNKNSMPDSESRWHKNRANQVRYERGLIKPVENKDGLTAYYYVATQATSDNANSSLEMIRRESNFKAVRLFATDIILLGNLDPKNIYGIPQFFKCLPSTTANVPPIATIEEVLDPNEREVIYDKDTSGNADDSGNTITTGMDWNHDGDEKTPRYKTGLFIDLACTYAGTKPKSCINVERISELGVSVDMTHNMAYHEGGNSTQYGQIDNDGFITKYELDDMENRAMFATLNHIGFIPQEYQDSISGYTTQVHDKNTNYLIPKFKYIYPVDFDGRMQVPMDLYKNGFEQATFDERDESYITFRMGAEQSLDYRKNSEERIRHFYHARNNDDMYDMPLYNNSYYFYFGIKKGSTAIDKFNKMFYAPCFTQEKMPFTLDIETQGKSYCPEAYTSTPCDCPSTSGVCRYNYGSNMNKAYAYIKITSDDIRTPYSYKLYDQFNELIVEDEGMETESFVIGGQIDDSGNTVSNCNGWIFHQVKNNNDEYERIDENLDPYYLSGLTNQEYILEVTDADGRTITEKVKLDVPKISGEYKATKLGTKFYNSATTRIDYICHDDNAFYGKIEMTSFSVDGYNCNLTGVQYLGYSNEYTTSSTTIDSEGNKQIETNTVEDDTRGRYIFCVTGESQDISNTVVAYLEISVLKSTKENLMRNCMCDDNSSSNESYEAPYNIGVVNPSDSPINLIAVAQNTRTTPVEMKISGATVNSHFLGFQAAVKDGETIVEPAKITFYFYQPNRYVVKIIQGCTDCAKLIMDNSSEEIVTIQNGEPFITTLNKMPTKFILGTVSDTNNASIANTSYFYRSSAVRNETDYNIKGWYGLHEEDSYMFSRRDENKTYNYNQLMWEDFFKNATDDIASPGMKRTILKFKFDNMFKLSEGAYITTDSSCKFDFEARGGVSPILYRMVAPIYNDMEKGRDRYVIKDFFNTQCPQEFPNIVADNYSLPLLNGRPRYEGHYQGGVPDSPHFNQQTYSSHEFLGNYFAAFTRDGSYINKRQIDGVKIKIERSPSFASVSPIDSSAPKILGKDDTGDIAEKFKFAHTSGTQNLDGDEGRNVQPYLRGIYVDRRFDYDFTVLAPVIGNNISLYTDRDRNIVWKGGRLSGWTYNGIEMSYDENYNIISADTHSGTVETYSPAGEPIGTDVEYTAATFNKRLEYTYKYDCAHRCLTCGYQFKDMVSTCPNCHSTNIRYFHGENVEQQRTNKIINSYNEQEDRVYSAYTYEPTAHITDKENFNGGETRIPGIVVTPPNEANYTLDDAVTYYHKWNGDWDCDWRVGEPVWGKWNVNRNQNGELFGFYDKYDIEDSNLPLIKEYYTSYINNFDIRHLYWSLFNYSRLNYYTTDNPNQQRNGYGEAAINNPDNPFYVYRYPLYYFDDPEWYNGDFNRDDVVQNTSTNSGRTRTTTKVPYPTKRFIDIGNLPSVSLYAYETQCCSYAMKSYITDDGKIMAETEGGETTEINLQWIRPVTIIPPNASSTDYANITYNPYPGYCGHEPFTDCVKFSAATASMAFKYNSYTCDDFEVYTKTPRIIQVLPYINGRDIDGIGFYKTCNPRTEFNGIYGDNLSLSDAINFITLDAGRFENESVNIWELIRGGDGGKNIFLPENVERRDNGYVTKYGVPVNGSFFVKKDEWLVSDDDDFTNIEFRKNLNSLYNSSTHQKAVVFTILVEREYRYVDDDNLVRHINTVETTDLYDCRDLFMKITLRGRTAASSAETELTYVEMREGGVSGISGVNESSTSYGEEEIEVDVSGEGGKSSGTINVPTTDVKDTELGKDTTKIYIQTITFDMKFDTNSGRPIPDRQNESFADYSMMSYVFRFFNLNNEQFDVIPSEVFMFEESANVNVLRFTLRWPVNMGIIADPQWSGNGMNGNIPVEVYARTPSNFIYKLSNFTMAFCCGQDVNGECKKSSNVEEDIKAPMKPSPSDDGNPVRHISHLRIGGTSCNCDF